VVLAAQVLLLALEELDQHLTVVQVDQVQEPSEEDRQAAAAVVGVVQVDPMAPAAQVVQEQALRVAAPAVEEAVTVAAAMVSLR
jgi:hypothetical protein